MSSPFFLSTIIVVYGGERSVMSNCKELGHMFNRIARILGRPPGEDAPGLCPNQRRQQRRIALSFAHQAVPSLPLLK